MKTGWQMKSLGEVCRFIDYRGRTPEKTESGLRLITAKNVKMGFLQRQPMEFVSPDGYRAWMTRGIPNIGDVLFTTEAPLANVAQLDTDERVVFAQRIIVLQPTEFNLDRTFLKYQLLSDSVQQRIHQKGTGATVKGIKASLLKNVEIVFPPLPEQQRIVGILDEALDGIATAEANAEKNLQNARAIFESHMQGVFNQRGEGWVEKPLGALASFRNGINYTKESKGERVKIVGVKDFQKNYWVPSQNLDTVTIDGELSKLDFLKQSDILAVRSNGNVGLIGRCILAGEVPGRISYSGFTIRIRLSTGEVLPEYLCHFMKCTSSRKRLTDGGTGTNIKSLNQQTLSALRVPFPSVSQQKALVARLESISEETQRLESIYRQKLAALDALKKSLLNQAFTGVL